MIDSAPLFPLALAYAEIHFRFFRFQPGLLFRSWPEAVFDVPARCVPGHELPVVLVVNDIDTFPVETGPVSITVSSHGEKPKLFTFPDIGKYEMHHTLSQWERCFLFPIPRDSFGNAMVHVNATMAVSRNGKRRLVINDNLPTSSKMPFSCILAGEMFPGSNYCLYGDMHVHSSFSRSHVEFGPPVGAIARMAKAVGLSFIAITDHSYDLACRLDDFLQPDSFPTPQRWKAVLDEIETHNTENVAIIPGEEISCYTKKRRVVHLCGYGLGRFLAGVRDGARRNALGDNTQTIEEIVDAIERRHGLAFAAHPGSRASVLERLFLGRGSWTLRDCGNALHGIQALNSDFAASWRRAKKLWIQALQQGMRYSLVAGNDAHGDFNRYRYIRYPFVKVGELFGRCFAYARTGVYGGPGSREDILKRIRQGKTFVTTGPFCTLSRSESPRDSVIGIDDSMLSDAPLFAHALSTAEFGGIRALYVVARQQGSMVESIVLSVSPDDLPYRVCREIPVTILPAAGYLRAEVICRRPDGSETMACTSACFFRRE